MWLLANPWQLDPMVYNNKMRRNESLTPLLSVIVVALTCLKPKAPYQKSHKRGQCSYELPHGVAAPAATQPQHPYQLLVSEKYPKQLLQKESSYRAAKSHPTKILNCSNSSNGREHIGLAKSALIKRKLLNVSVCMHTHTHTQSSLDEHMWVYVGAALLYYMITSFKQLISWLCKKHT